MLMETNESVGEFSLLCRIRCICVTAPLNAKPKERGGRRGPTVLSPAWRMGDSWQARSPLVRGRGLIRRAGRDIYYAHRAGCHSHWFFRWRFTRNGVNYSKSNFANRRPIHWLFNGYVDVGVDCLPQKKSYNLFYQKNLSNETHKASY